MDIKVHYVSKKLAEFRGGSGASGGMNKKEAAQLAAELAQAVADLLGIDE